MAGTLSLAEVYGGYAGRASGAQSTAAQAADSPMAGAQPTEGGNSPMSATSTFVVMIVLLVALRFVYEVID